MKNTIQTIDYALSDFSDYTPSAFLVWALHWADQQGFWQPFNRLLDVAMKKVVYTPVQKVQTLIASIMIGCQYNKDINSRLVPDEVTASLLGMARFPDQSQTNLLLRRMDETNLGELEAVHAEHLRQYERFAPSTDWYGYLLVDIDQCGLIANGKSYELSRKGYFPRRRGERGYQMSAAWLGGSHITSGITLALRLDPGNIHCAVRFREMVELSERHASTSHIRRKVVYRVDGGYGTQPQIRWLLATNRLFIAKAATTRPQKWAGKVAPDRWQRVDAGVRVGEVEAGPQVRAVVCEVTPPSPDPEQGRVERREYSVLLTNLSAQQFDAVALWHLYAGRQTIEAFFKAGRTVYGLSNLRSRNFSAICAFVWLVFITHNLLVWVRQALFGGTSLAQIGIRELVEKIGRIPAWRECTEQGWRLHLPAQNAAARLFAQALRPRWAQLQLPLRLYET